ncbi:MAG: V8-like Glu-specific endopeptidase [Bacteriovoracaceae bacterium]|jgi:V8-like Glu-specific endopeptidase
MTLRTISALFVSMTLSFSVMAGDKVVYGDDDRLDLFEATNALHLDLAKSTAAMISHSKLTDNGDGTTSVSGGALSSRGICKSAKFADQITAANCSGFLVGKDLLVTAGHCITSMSACKNSAWVFDFAVETSDDDAKAVPTSSVYKCVEIIERDLNRGTKDDYALIRLERNVDDRDALTVRTSGKVADGTELVVIGHPTGLPSKIAAGAVVRNNNGPVFFNSNLDTFGGNSGSAVFDSKTGTVEGILVRGETDYVYDSTRGCRVPKQCTNEGCRGEDVTRITNIKALMTLVEENNK